MPDQTFDPSESFRGKTNPVAAIYSFAFVIDSAEFARLSISDERKLR